MTSRELVHATIRRENPGRVPFRLALPPGWEDDPDRGLVAEVRALNERAPVDLASYFCYNPPRDWAAPDGLPAWGRAGNHRDGACEWGARWNAVYVTHHPLEDWASWSSYRFPDPQAPGRTDEAEAFVAANEGRYRLWFFGYSLFERMWILRGFENLLMDPYLYPDEFVALRDRVVEFSLRIIDRMLELPFDGVMVGDDLGSQASLLMDPKTWRQLYKPGYAAMFDRIRGKGRDVWMHTDGNIMAIVPDLIEIGLQVLNPVQPSALDVERLVGGHGDRLAFFGGIDVQQTLWSGSPADVRAEIEGLRRTLGSRGGWIPANTNAVLPGTPLRNLKTALETLLELPWNDRTSS